MKHRIPVGVDYYPEHWPRDRWPTDAALMKAAGFEIVRLAEFAWVNMQPSEDTFDFGWLDEILDVLGRAGISAILGTPTAVMPAWVARKYPETLAVTKTGQRVIWGVRKENCFSSGAFRLLSQRITRAMAEHVRGNRHVIGWQTDNELDGPICYCQSCRADFQDWLRGKYGDLDSLNRAWGTHFWGHRVQTWDEIQHPMDDAASNPSALLDRRRHHSYLNVRFQREQVEIIRQLCPKHFVTHNFMGVAPVAINYFDLARDLDFVSWDNYPVWGPPAVRYDSAMAADLMRGLKKKNFWIMEQTAGPGGWGTMGRNPRPGEIRSVAYQQLAHGADGQIWFRCRTCTAGREQYWHGLLGHDGRALRRYNEAKHVANEYHKLEPHLAGTTVVSDVAILYDYDSLWALQIQPAYAEHEYRKTLARYYQALFRAGVNVDLVDPGADLTKYKLVLAPDLFVMDDALAQKLVALVKKGGVLMADCRTGVKDATGLCHDRTLPGKLTQVLGIEIQEYETLAKEMEYSVTGRDALSGQFSAGHFVDWITPRGAEVLAAYEDWHMKPYAAVTRKKSTRGVGWYVGAIMKEDRFYDALIAALLADAGIAPLLKPPLGVEVSVRRGPKATILFLINHTEANQTVDLPPGKKNLLTGKSIQGAIELDRHGVAVVAW